MPAFVDPSFFQITAPEQKAMYTRSVPAAQPVIQSGYEAFLAGGGVPGGLAATAAPRPRTTAPTVTQPSAPAADPYDSYYPAPDMSGGGQMALATYNIPAEMAGYVLWRGERKRALAINMGTLVQAAQSQAMTPGQLGRLINECMVRIPGKNAYRLNVRKLSRMSRRR